MPVVEPAEQVAEEQWVASSLQLIDGLDELVHEVGDGLGAVGQLVDVLLELGDELRRELKLSCFPNNLILARTRERGLDCYASDI